MSFRSWGTSDVVRQLKFLGFGQYASRFQANEICGVHLPLLTEDHLKELGVNSIGHRILMLRRFSDIANNMPVSPMEQETVRRMPPRTPNPPAKPWQELPAKATPQKSIPTPAPKRCPATPPRTPEARCLTPRKSILARDTISVTSETPKCLEKGWRIVGRSERLSDASSVTGRENQNVNASNVIQCQHCGKKLPTESAARHMRICVRFSHNRVVKK
jgi:hypothetical protein